MFKIGDKVIYPSIGLSVIKAVSNGRYVIESNQGMTILVPQPSANEILRHCVDSDTAKQYIKTVKKLKIDTSKTWNRRYRETMDLLKGDNFLSVLVAYKTLVILQANKDLSFGERKMLDHAKTLALSELTVSFNNELEAVKALKEMVND